MSIFLTKEDVAELTGWKTKAKQIQQLRTTRVIFWINGQGVPVVPRSAIEGRRDQKEGKRERVIPNALRSDGRHDAAGNWIPPGMRSKPNGDR